MFCDLSSLTPVFFYLSPTFHTDLHISRRSTSFSSLAFARLSPREIYPTHLDDLYASVQSRSDKNIPSDESERQFLSEAWFSQNHHIKQTLNFSISCDANVCLVYVCIIFKPCHTYRLVGLLLGDLCEH